jgi:hypothetical protein
VFAWTGWFTTSLVKTPAGLDNGYPASRGSDPGAFRAAGYTQGQMDAFSKVVEDRIAALNDL